MHRFQQLHGNLFIKQSFAIPPGDVNWSPTDHGYKLGSLVKYIRRLGPGFVSQKSPSLFQELNTLGFCWNTYAYRQAIAMAAFIKYKELYGHLDLHRTFQVPKDDERWPAELRGLKLGMIASHIRNYEVYNDLQKPLEELGFDFGYQKRPPNFEVIFESLLVYKEKHGHLLMPLEFYVSADDQDYPEAIRGCNLGRSVANLRRVGYYKEQRERLVSIGFPFCSVMESKFNFLFEGFQIYKQLYGSLKIPRNYVIPNTADFPKHLWGVRLGNKLQNIRQFRAFKQYSYRMADLGIVIPVSL